MKVLFAGTPDVAVPSLEALVDSRHEVVATVTRPDSRRGRGKRLHPSPVAEAAQRYGIETFTPETPEELLEVMGDVDVAVVVAFGMLLTEPLLERPAHGWVNMHFSLLPRWRGASPVQHTILAGDEDAGITTFRIVKALDAGPVYRCVSVPYGDETSGELLARLAVEGAPVILDTLDDIESGVEPTPQGEGDGSYAGLIHPDDVRIDWNDDAGRIYRLVRAANPDPMAWTTLAQERFRVLEASPSDSDGLVPGELRASKRELIVGTGDGALRLDLVQAAGKKAMAGADWARGVRLSEGTRFDG